MECVISVIRGKFETTTCAFCEKQITNTFMVTKKKVHDGELVSAFGVCKEHLDKINALMSGEFDIDIIYLEKYRKSQDKRLNLRR